MTDTPYEERDDERLAQQEAEQHLRELHEQEAEPLADEDEPGESASAF
jgi:hypothetical protein